MKNIKVLALGLLVAGMVQAPSTVSASGILVDDTFEGFKSKTVEGWTEIEKKSKSVKVKNNKVVMRDSKKGGISAGIVTSAVDTTNLKGGKKLNLAFNWKAKKKNEKSDKLFVSYKEDGGEWIKLFKGSDKKGKKSFSESIDFVLSQGVENVQFMISTKVSKGNKGKGEGFQLMDFVATGQDLSLIHI